MASPERHLVVLGCSATKSTSPGLIPAIDRYDGPTYRVLRSFLRESRWPSLLSVAVLSARYGLIGGLAQIDLYDQRMDRRRAEQLSEVSTNTLIQWGKSHMKVSLVLGKDYLRALNRERLQSQGVPVAVVEGPIGVKLNRLHRLLHAMEQSPRRPEIRASDRPFYFLPDWDDMLDMQFDFRADHFSTPDKLKRVERHSSQIVRPKRLCDGVLVSLAQHLGTKGVLRKFAPTDLEALAPRSLRTQFDLSEDQWMFGDPGAFSYVDEAEPTISTDQAVSLYEIFGFDLGASVDHIPAQDIQTNEGVRILSATERQARVDMTVQNAQAFIDLHTQRRCTFIPVGTIQGLVPEDYATQFRRYVDFGYRHVALGGLVPASDARVLEVAKAVNEARKKVSQPIWVHLFGVFRPKIQPHLRALKITSFDSATYFRKAWLRSDQNYFGTDKRWYAAIRVPMTADPRTRVRLKTSGISMERLQELEMSALDALNKYGDGNRALDDTLESVMAYEQLLHRSDDHGANLREAYRNTLLNRPWEQCGCSVCSQLGIHALIFRGANRNKRRGAHNTLMLYSMIHDPD